MDVNGKYTCEDCKWWGAERKHDHHGPYGKCRAKPPTLTQPRRLHITTLTARRWRGRLLTWPVGPGLPLMTGVVALHCRLRTCPMKLEGNMPSAAWTAGYEAGKAEGYNDGYGKGWKDGIEAAAELADNEEEPTPGEMPPEIIKAVLTGDTVYVENAILAGVRSTKKCIAAAIRKLRKP